MAKAKSKNSQDFFLFKFTLPKSLSFKLKIPLLPMILSLLLLMLLLTTYQVIFSDKFFPGVYIGDTHLVGLNKSQAQRVLQAKFSLRSEDKLQFSLPSVRPSSQSFTIDLATSSATANFIPALNQAFEIGHSDPLTKKLTDQLITLFKGAIIYPQIDLSLNDKITNISQKVNISPKDATLSFVENASTPEAQIKITPSQEGLSLDDDKLKSQIKDYLIFGKTTPLLPTKVAPPKITTQRAKTAKQILETSYREPVNLSFDDQKWTIDTKTLITLIDLASSDRSLIDQDKLGSYLKKEVGSQIDQEVKESQFHFDQSSKRVTQFVASQPGQRLDIEKTAQLISLALDNQRAKTITLPVEVIQPKITTDQVNDLGIKELLGRGTSNFAGSIPNRIYNLNLAASRINGVLLASGESFSFNDKVGDISAGSGYKPAYVIKEGRTVLDDGGGVCQDSTTLFRAVLNAGLPILARTAHAYRVGYYEQGFPPGLDATVFAPSADFRFKNDTPAHILIQAYTQGLTLYVDIYGSSDGRVSNLTKPIVTNQTPPPPEIRQDDPTLPKGTVKQVDFPAWGASVSFKRTVTRGGQEIINETFRSNYRPWQAIYLVGTQ